MKKSLIALAVVGTFAAPAFAEEPASPHTLTANAGFCDKCGVEIGIKRLEARPTATLCIDCKTLDELKEKQMAK